MFSAAETTEADPLHEFAEALAAYLDEPTPFRFAGWDEAIARVMRLATHGPKPVVIDEFPFLAKATPALPSLIQRVLQPGARLLLFGGAGFSDTLVQLEVLVEVYQSPARVARAQAARQEREANRARIAAAVAGGRPRCPGASPELQQALLQLMNLTPRSSPQQGAAN
jgi:hypothetical protein